MKPKENPDPGAEGFQVSSCSATLKASLIALKETSEKSALTRRLEPLTGTQGAIILKLLRSRPGSFIGVYEMMRAAHCPAVHSVVSDLRSRYGFRVKNRQCRSKNGVVLSEYLLRKEDTE